jgi:hypothetical protein
MTCPASRLEAAVNVESNDVDRPLIENIPILSSTKLISNDAFVFKSLISFCNPLTLAILIPLICKFIGPKYSLLLERTEKIS